LLASIIIKKEGLKMENRCYKGCLLVAIILIGLLTMPTAALNKEASVEKKVTVLNPRGQPPPIKGIPMAPRLDTLAGKTVYIIDVRFPGTEILFDEIQKWFATNMPGVKTVVRQKRGNYFEDDPALWAEIKKNGHAVIMGVGH
jgi:hypothetical protein